MKMTQFPACCGVVIISDLDTYSGGISHPDYRHSPTHWKKAIKKRLNTAKNAQNRAYVLTIYASQQPFFIKDGLEELGFKLQDVRRNPRSTHNIYQYKLDLRDYKPS